MLQQVWCFLHEEVMDKKWLVSVLWCLYCISITEGIVLMRSSPHAVKDQGFQFTCTVGETSSSNILLFRRGNKTKCTILLSPSCGQLVGQGPYSCFCGQSGMYHMNISSVSQQDEGTWVCDHGRQDSNTVSVPVYYGPSKVSVNTTFPVTVIEDVTVSLTSRCSADCKPACSYIWMKGTQQASDNRDLPVGRFRRGQGGDYRCTARNTVSAASQILTVNVQWHPGLTTHDCPSWIIQGKTESCTCRTSDIGHPAGTVQWLNPGNQTVSSSQSSSVQLNLSSIDRSDKRMTYICRAWNSLPNSNSDATYIANIAYLECPSITQDKQEVSENDSVTVTCKVVSNPTVEMTIDINGNRTTAFSNNITYTIERAPCLHKSDIRCTTKNNQSNEEMNVTAQLNVTCYPRQVPGRPTGVVVSGKRPPFAYLTADVIANPLPNFTWFKHSNRQMPIDNGTDSLIVSSGLHSTLKVPLKSEDDYTNYSVVVENSLGKTALFFSVTKAVSKSAVQNIDIIPVVPGVGAAALVILIIVIIVILHRRGFLKCKGNSNKNECPTQQGDGAHAIDNVYQEGDNGLKYGRDEDGLMYVGVEFGNQATPTAAPEWTDEATEYAGIAHGVVGCPLPPEKEDEKK